jgi:hypothetical protein
MADEPKVNPPAAPAPPTTGATPSLQGVTKPGQGTVPQTPGTGPAAPVPPQNIGAANIAAVSPRPEPAPKAGDASLVNKNTSNAAGTEQNTARTAPAVSTDTPFRRRRRQLEQELKNLDDNRSHRNSIARSTVAAQLAELKDIEARQQGRNGLNDLTPAGNLLMVDGSIHEQYPDDHLRWVNETIQGRAAMLQSKGYERVPGQVAGGDMVLWKVPREQWARTFAVKQEQTERGLRKATSGSRDDQVQELQKFFDQHGVNLDANKIVLREG